MVRPHSHEAADKVDAAMEASAEGIRALWISLAVLGATAVIQAIVVAFSGSVALLGDTLHNGVDALTAVPLGVAFVIGRRPANRRYTYGMERAEDLAGLVIIVFIAASSALAAYEAVDRLAHPRPVSNLAAVAVAAGIGFAGNELVARYRIRVGRKIGSATSSAPNARSSWTGTPPRCRRIRWRWRPSMTCCTHCRSCERRWSTLTPRQARDLISTRYWHRIAK